MNTLTQDSLERRPIHLRDGSRLTFEHSALLRAVFEAVQMVAWPHPESVAEGSGVTPEPILRTLLTYSYAAGVYGSEEIEQSAEDNVVVRYLCANHRPRREAIREFRRRNRQALEAAVACVLSTAPAPELARVEAGERIARAMQEDCLALDD